jgi:DnaJ-class molecular chaperone
VALMDNNFEIMLNPEKFGYMQCPHCNGYGSSLKDIEEVDICTRCGGSGLIKKEIEESSS